MTRVAPTIRENLLTWTPTSQTRAQISPTPISTPTPTESRMRTRGELGTDPFLVDSDGDTITDLEELQAGTNPLEPDTDMDGLRDDQELYFGFDPNNPNTIGDGLTSDGDLFVVSACDLAEEEPTDFYSNSVGDWMVALPSAFNNYTDLMISSAFPSTAAAVFDDAANEVAGFILSTPTNGLDPVQTLLGYRSGIQSAGSITQDRTEGEFTTHDSNKAAPGEYQLSVSSKSAKKLRDDILFALASFGAPDVSNLPSSAGNAYNKYYIKISVIARPTRNITTVAVAPEQFYTTKDAVQFRMSDLTNTTNVAQVNDVERLRCYPFPANTEVPAADFYWVLDQSGSMNADFQKVKSFAAALYQRLQNTALDFRLGVTNMDQSFLGKLRLGRRVDQWPECRHHLRQRDPVLRRRLYQELRVQRLFRRSRAWTLFRSRRD